MLSLCNQLETQPLVTMLVSTYYYGKIPNNYQTYQTSIMLCLHTMKMSLTILHGKQSHHYRKKGDSLPVPLWDQ